MKNKLAPTLNQISFLSQQIQRNENLSKHYDLQDCWSKLNKELKSVQQYKYILYLLAEKKYSKLNELMTRFNFKTNV